MGCAVPPIIKLHAQAASSVLAAAFTDTVEMEMIIVGREIVSQASVRDHLLAPRMGPVVLIGVG